MGGILPPNFFLIFFVINKELNFISCLKFCCLITFLKELLSVFLMNVVIIGAGPVGCYTGHLLAKLGCDVSIYENHGQIGSPIQCTGILTTDFDKFGFPMKEFLVNTIDSVEVNAPKGSVTLEQKNYIVCRQKFDRFFGNLAEESGAKILLNHTFLERRGHKIVVRDVVNNKDLVLNYDIIIAADGPLSPTAKAYGLYHPKRENFFGIQARVEGKFDSSKIKTYFGREVCPGLFSWIVPESSKVARIGLACKKDGRYYFDKFMEDQQFVVKEMQAGMIPVYHPRQKLCRGNCYLVGDASSYVKATTFGGIIPAFKQAEILADCIVNGKDYEKEIKPVRKRMWLHLQLHKIFEKFKDKDWNYLVEYAKSPGVKGVLEEYARDNPFPIVFRAVLKEPRFLFFLKYLV